MDSNIYANDEQAGSLAKIRQFFRFLFLLMILSIFMGITWKVGFADQQALEADFSIENNPPENQVATTSTVATAPTEPGITLRAANGKTIGFKTQNGNTINNTLPQISEIPHLVLSRNLELTNTEERMLIVTASNLEVPPAGLTVTLKLETQHGDPDLGGGDNNRILVWNESRRIENIGETTRKGEVVGFSVEFGKMIQSSNGISTTPTGYYRYEVLLEGGNQLQQTIGQDHALLLERQSIAKLNFDGEAKDVGPGEIALYYSDMFPFQKDAATRLSRNEVPGYVQDQLLPGMTAAIHQQMNWGLSWDRAWTNLRVDEYANRLSTALTDGRTWFHGPAPVRGHSAISINVNGGNNEEYDSLTDGIMSTFHHELFHSFQRSIHQSYGGNGQVSGKDKAWRFFSEGTASLIPSIAQPEVQFSQGESRRAYLAKAAKFVGGGGFPGDLNNSYAEMTPYRAAIYWRFLYEQCGGMSSEYADPAAGMGLIRRTMEVLFSMDVVDISTSTDLVEALPHIMDVVLSSPEATACPFATYEQSLSHFARAIYALQLENGRCSIPGLPKGCGFYDPNNLYSQPFINQLHFTGQEIVFGAEAQSQPSGIRSSFGMDFVDVVLNPEIQGKRFTIEIFTDLQGEAEFSIQLWQLIGPEDGTLPGVSPSSASTVESNKFSESFLYTFDNVDIQNYNRIGLIITRLDSNESLDPNGRYTIVLRPANGD